MDRQGRRRTRQEYRTSNSTLECRLNFDSQEYRWVSRNATSEVSIESSMARNCNQSHQEESSQRCANADRQQHQWTSADSIAGGPHSSGRIPQEAKEDKLLSGGKEDSRTKNRDTNNVMKTGNESTDNGQSVDVQLNAKVPETERRSYDDECNRNFNRPHGDQCANIDRQQSDAVRDDPRTSCIIGRCPQMNDENKLIGSGQQQATSAEEQGSSAGKCDPGGSGSTFEPDDCRNGPFYRHATAGHTVGDASPRSIQNEASHSVCIDHNNRTAMHHPDGDENDGRNDRSITTHPDVINSHLTSVANSVQADKRPSIYDLCGGFLNGEHFVEVVPCVDPVSTCHDSKLFIDEGCGNSERTYYTASDNDSFDTEGGDELSQVSVSELVKFFENLSRRKQKSSGALSDATLNCAPVERGNNLFKEDWTTVSGPKQFVLKDRKLPPCTIHTPNNPGLVHPTVNNEPKTTRDIDEVRNPKQARERELCFDGKAATDACREYTTTLYDSLQDGIENGAGQSRYREEVSEAPRSQLLGHSQTLKKQTAPKNFVNPNIFPENTGSGVMGHPGILPEQICPENLVGIVTERTDSSMISHPSIFTKQSDKEEIINLNILSEHTDSGITVHPALSGSEMIAGFSDLHPGQIVPSNLSPPDILPEHVAEGMVGEPDDFTEQTKTVKPVSDNFLKEKGAIKTEDKSYGQNPVNRIPFVDEDVGNGISFEEARVACEEVGNLSGISRRSCSSAKTPESSSKPKNISTKKKGPFQRRRGGGYCRRIISCTVGIVAFFFIWSLLLKIYSP